MGALFTAHHLGCKAIVALTGVGLDRAVDEPPQDQGADLRPDRAAVSQRKMALYRNVRRCSCPPADRDEALAAPRRCWSRSGVLKPGDTYAITCGEPMGYPAAPTC
jgi:pyruvate kinase